MQIITMPVLRQVSESGNLSTKTHLHVPRSLGRRKTNTKANTMANHNKRKRQNEPMRTQSKYTYPAPSAGKRV